MNPNPSKQENEDLFEKEREFKESLEKGKKSIVDEWDFIDQEYAREKKDDDFHTRAIEDKNELERRRRERVANRVSKKKSIVLISGDVRKDRSTEDFMDFLGKEDEERKARPRGNHTAMPAVTMENVLNNVYLS